MKKYSKLSFLGILILSLAYAACRKDDSTLDLNKIPGITIDTTGQSTLSVYQFDNLVVKPKLIFQGIDENDLSYSWKITMLYNDTATTEIGQERDLDAVIGFQPTEPSKELKIVYTVTDNKRNLKYYMVWPLTVRNNMGMGLLVGETDGNGNSDFSHIMNPDVSLDYTDLSVKHNVYSSLNGKYINGELKKLKYFSMINGNGILALTNNSISRISAQTKQLVGTDNDLFYIPASFENVQNVYSLYQNDILLLNGKMHLAWMGITAKWPVPMDLELQMPDIMAVNPFSNNQGEDGVRYTPPVPVNLYEEAEGKFYYMRINIIEKKFYPYTQQAGQAFSAENLPGKANLAAGYTVDKGFLHVLKDKTSGAVGLYLISGGVDDASGNLINPPMPLAHHDISSAPGIQNATLFTILDDQKVFYYASGNKIYAVMYGGSTPVIEERYTAPAGETITAMDVYRHPGYPLLSSYISTNNKLLLVGTYGTEGKAHFLPIKNPGLGTLDIANSKTFGGFWKITTFAPQL